MTCHQPQLPLPQSPASNDGFISDAVLQRAVRNLASFVLQTHLLHEHFVSELRVSRYALLPTFEETVLGGRSAVLMAVVTTATTSSSRWWQRRATTSTRSYGLANTKLSAAKTSTHTLSNIDDRIFCICKWSVSRIVSQSCCSPGNNVSSSRRTQRPGSGRREARGMTAWLLVATCLKPRRNA